jgi:hypothetical protein
LSRKIAALIAIAVGSSFAAAPRTFVVMAGLVPTIHAFNKLK